jgi:hypothetical protein
VLVAGLAATAAFVVVNAPQPTSAAWTSTKTANVAVNAVIPTPPTALTCGAGSGLLSGSVPFTWSAPPGTAPSGYTLKWTGAATGSVTTATTSGNVPSPALGTTTVSVYADYGSWESAAGIQTRSIFGVVIVGWTCT